VVEREVRENLPDDREIVQSGDQAQAAPTMSSRPHVDAEGRHVILHLLPVMWRNLLEPQ
jgi:hypothetical protein